MLFLVFFSMSFFMFLFSIFFLCGSIHFFPFFFFHFLFVCISFLWIYKLVYEHLKCNSYPIMKNKTCWEGDFQGKENVFFIQVFNYLEGCVKWTDYQMKMFRFFTSRFYLTIVVFVTVFDFKKRYCFSYSFVS